MEMQQIRYFLTLSRTLNFTRAAEECHISQSALTRAIQALEQELGGALIRREHARSHLTELGKRMAPYLERCYDSALAAKSLADSIVQSKVAPLAIAMAHSVNVQLIMSLVAEMFRAFPGLQLRLLRATGAEVLDMLKKGDVEIAIAGPMRECWDRIDHWPLFEERFELAMAEGHSLARDNALTLEKLKNDAVFCMAGCEMREALARALEGAGLAPVQRHEAATHEDLMALVLSGLGAAIVPQSAPATEGVRRALLDDLPLTRTVSAYAVAGRRREAPPAAFLTLLRSADLASR
jgi:DNA-binding transcriptional LysR family regulator